MQVVVDGATLDDGNTGETELMSAADQKHDCCVSDKQTARNCFQSLVLYFILVICA